MNSREEWKKYFSVLAAHYDEVVEVLDAGYAQHGPGAVWLIVDPQGSIEWLSYIKAGLNPDHVVWERLIAECDHSRQFVLEIVWGENEKYGAHRMLPKAQPAALSVMEEAE